MERAAFIRSLRLPRTTSQGDRSDYIPVRRGAIEPFAHLRPQFRGVDSAKARRLLAAAAPFNPSKAEPLGRALEVRDLTALRSEAYARICHPLQGISRRSGDWEYQTWRDVLGDIPITAESSLRDLLPGEQAKEFEIEPLIGSLGPKLAPTLADLIQKELTESNAFFYFWEGLGGLRGASGAQLYSGPLRVVHSLHPYPDALFESPTLWWSPKETWFIATHTDATSSYLGGPRALVRNLLAHPAVEAQEASTTTVVDDWTAIPR